MGTSLKVTSTLQKLIPEVYPFAGLVNSVPDTTPRLVSDNLSHTNPQLFNQEAVGAFTKGAQEKVEDGKLVQSSTGLEGTYRDVAVLGDIDEGVLIFSNLCGWDINK